MKFSFFTAEKNLCILHGQVFVMKKSIIELCKHVLAKVNLVPCSVNLTGKRDKVGNGEVTINNVRIIHQNYC